MDSPQKVFSLNFDLDRQFNSLSFNESDGYNNPDEEQLQFTSSSFITAEGQETLEKGDESSEVFISPNGTRTWCPVVDDVLKPKEGSTFASLEDVLSSYQEYAHAGGFSVRIGQRKKDPNGNVTHKYLRCNKAGKPERKLKFDSETTSRQSTFIRTDCKAHVLVKFCSKRSVYYVLKLVEGHNHSLVEGFNRDLTKICRKLPFSTKEFIHNMSLNSVGPVKAYRLMVSMMGGHHNVHGTPNDFKNFSMKTRRFIGDRDTQLLVNRLHERSESLPEFYFDYVVSDGKLRGMFWADEISKVNYKAFGDVLAFDATYQTNKYDMIFVPFTGVDNHKCCVTFGAGLLSCETIESYTWLLENFLKAHGKKPTLVLTDQDPSMRQAVLNVLKGSRHRLCMWHIMKKLPAKVSGDLLQNTDIRERLHQLVWSNYMKPSTFETRWQELIESFSLKNNEWLSEMYEIRERWIPAYFREIPMCCLLRTTSVCESSNASFKVNSTSANTLVQFMLCFETRIESERYRQRTADFKTSTISYRSEVDLPIEKHAFDIYTHTIFKEVQREIKEGMYYCFILNTEVFERKHVYSVSQRNYNGGLHTFKVKFDCDTHTLDCSCMCFTRIGYLCRHAFCVLRVNQIDEIPPKYVSKRWSRYVLPRNVYSIESRYGVDNSEGGVLKRKIMEVVDQCVEVLRGDTVGLGFLVEKMKELKVGIARDGRDVLQRERANVDVVEELVGQQMEVEVSVNNPNGIRTKGCGRKRRFQGPGEKMTQKPPKVPRLCKTCKKYVTGHDSRNCKMKNQDAESVVGEGSN
ncbi:hypothetical protein SSX86_032365 [Deinandra increscens subsp. villosa]|uniref:SWIM-type domain-containing protein n=1 Tax=Deinandra increscens subsp. villosa TaxID=3103831 RepID=A0AAP0C7U7_9ASTR